LDRLIIHWRMQINIFDTLNLQSIEWISV